MAPGSSRRLAISWQRAGWLISWILLSCGPVTMQARVVRVVVESRAPEVPPERPQLPMSEFAG